MQIFADEIRIDLSILPQEARDDLISHYFSLIKKHTGQKQVKEITRQDFLNNLLPKPVKKFIPLKRSEIYVR